MVVAGLRFATHCQREAVRWRRLDRGGAALECDQQELTMVNSVWLMVIDG